MSGSLGGYVRELVSVGCGGGGECVIEGGRKLARRDGGMNGRTRRTLNCSSRNANCDLLHNEGTICCMCLRLPILPGPTLYRDIKYFVLNISTIRTGLFPLLLGSTCHSSVHPAIKR